MKTADCLVLIALQSRLVSLANAATQASTLLWYASPAEKDFYNGLPIGNGRLGAVLNGHTDKELIHLNEESIWSGGPIDRVNPNALPNLAAIREQLATGRLSEADDNWIANFTGVPDGMRAYQPAGQLLLDFPHPFGETSGYNHTLDIVTAVAKLSYEFGGVKYTREAFVNYPSNILALKLSASEPGSLEFDLGLDRDQNITAHSADAEQGIITLSGTGSVDDYFKFASKARVVITGGQTSSNGTGLQIRGADEAWIYYDAETSYYYPDGNYAEIVDARLETAVVTGYEDLRSEAIKDYQGYFGRTSVDFGDSPQPFGQLNTTGRQRTWQKGNNITDDVELLTLGFNMGKYLLISSSRPGTQPANLQGIWNRDFGPAWDSKFTLNINLEMNYWPMQPHNLPELAAPVYDLLDRLRVTGGRVARAMYGARGFACHHNTDGLADCAPYHASSIFSPFPLGGAWLALEAVEHFRFTRDAAFARARALPILRDAVAFIVDYVTEQADAEGNVWMAASPACSPENSYVIPPRYAVAGRTTGLDRNAMVDRSIMWEALTGFAELAAAAGSGEDEAEAEAEKALALRARLQPPAVGTRGQLLEWAEEYEENDMGHRHFSPLVCVHPGSWVRALTNATAADAARALMRDRFAGGGGGGNSWSVAWAAALYARLLDADRARAQAVDLLARWVFPNLMSRNGGYFQLDGNAGLTAALTEMALQSHAGALHLGPALPTDRGRLRGWAARGGFLVDMDWADGDVTRAVITSRVGGLLIVRVQDGRGFAVDGKVVDAAEGGIETTAGQKVIISF